MVYFFSFIFFNYYFLLYNIVLVLPYINKHLSWVYICSPSWTPPSHLPPHTIPLVYFYKISGGFFSGDKFVAHYVFCWLRENWTANVWWPTTDRLWKVWHYWSCVKMHICHSCGDFCGLRNQQLSLCFSRSVIVNTP